MRTPATGSRPRQSHADCPCGVMGRSLIEAGEAGIIFCQGIGLRETRRRRRADPGNAPRLKTALIGHVAIGEDHAGETFAQVGRTPRRLGLLLWLGFEATHRNGCALELPDPAVFSRIPERVAMLVICQLRQHLPQLHAEPGQVRRRHRQPVACVAKRRAFGHQAFGGDPHRLGQFAPPAPRGEGGDILVERGEAEEEGLMPGGKAMGGFCTLATHKAGLFRPGFRRGIGDGGIFEHGLMAPVGRGGQERVSGGGGGGD